MRRPPLFCAFSPATALVGLLVVTIGGPPARAKTPVGVTWLGGNSPWSDPRRWDPAVVPNNDPAPGGATYNVTLPGFNGNGPSLDVAVGIENLSLAADSALGSVGGGSLTVNGVTRVDASVAYALPNLFATDATFSLGTLSTYDAATRSLAGGLYAVRATANNSALMSFRGADIATNSANIVLVGPGAALRDQNGGVDALRNLAVNAGSLQVGDGRNFTTAGSFSNPGTLVVGDTQTAIVTNGHDRPSALVISGNLTNYDAASQTLRSGTYRLEGSTQGNSFLQFPDADIRRNNASIVVGANTQIRDEQGRDALARLSVNTGQFTAQGGTRTFTPDGGTLTNSGGLFKTDGSVLTVTGAFLQNGAGAQTRLGEVASGVSRINVSGRADLLAGRLVFSTYYLFDGSQSVLTVQGRFAAATDAGIFGTGTLHYQGRASVAGSVSPGNLPSEGGPYVDVETGRLSFEGGLTLENTSDLQIKLGGTAPGLGYDLLLQRDTAEGAGGVLLLGGQLTLSLLDGFTPTTTSTFKILDADALSGTFGNVGTGGRIEVDDAAGNPVGTFGLIYGSRDVTLQDFQAVPEPSTWALLGAGAGLLGMKARRRTAAGVEIKRGARR